MSRRKRASPTPAASVAPDRDKRAEGEEGDFAPPVASESRLRRHVALLIIAAAYLVIFPYFRALENPNENVRIWATRALAVHGTLRLEPVIREWGDVTDTAAVDGARVSSKAPGTTFIGVPVHFVHDRLGRLFLGQSPSEAASTWALRVFTVVLPLLGFFAFFARRVEAETQSPRARDLLTLALALGTMFYPYGIAFVGHAQSAALLFSGFVLLLPAPGAPLSPRRLALAGALVGLSVVFEYQALFAAALVAAFAAYQLRARAWPFFLGALGPALLLGAYHTVLLGRPWELPYAHLDDPGYATYHHSQGFLGLGRPRARILGVALFSVDYGLFAYAPLLAAGLGLALWASFRRGDAAAALTVLITAVMAVFLSGMANWRGGWCAAGPRYIAVVVPFLVFAVARAFRAVIAPRPFAVLGVATLALVSIGLCGLSALFPHFPVQLDNPIFDLVVPLLAQGYVPHGLGTALGLSGVAALLPWLLAMLGAIALVARGLPGGARGAGLAVLVAALVVGALSTYGKKTREDARVRGFIENIWEPRPPGATKGASDGPA